MIYDLSGDHVVNVKYQQVAITVKANGTVVADYLDGHQPGAALTVTFRVAQTTQYDEIEKTALNLLHKKGLRAKVLLVDLEDEMDDLTEKAQVPSKGTLPC